MNKRCYVLPSGTRLDRLEQSVYDVVIIGAGIAGMTAALNLDAGLRVMLVNKSEASDSSTYRAQGGIAVAVGPDDSPGQHIADTLRVGQGLCREDAVRVLAEEGPAALSFLQDNGVDFNFRENGLDLTREAGHSRSRVVHYYDYTGRQISQTLRKQVNDRPNIDQFSDCFLVDVLTADGECCGCVLFCSGKLIVVFAKAVVIASGGYAGLYARSSNSSAAGGDGIAAAYRAGAVLADMEFVQFHPTTFTTAAGEVFLLTEALRGEGAVLRNYKGERFMAAYHPDGELAPRDEVSRAITREVKNTGRPVYLDARHLGREHLTQRFRQVYAKLAENKYLLEQDLVPVAPAAHYAIGGILTDLWAKSNIPRLYACGEAAATGVHGANRLASNSLLEGVVFGRRAAVHINEENLAGRVAADVLPPVEACATGGDAKLMARILEDAAGVVRSENELVFMLGFLRRSVVDRLESPVGTSAFRACNSFQLTGLILEAALMRRESRGTHYRADYPDKNDERFGRHLMQQWGKEVTFG